ncbi:MAG: tripartite tricarboxylate transporter TctB family protein [Betaproteobacteria bacterium]|nr:tripartite tricarboxylate transporter TctB family protein [Betaproteobacteria bacterium]MCL4699176.1 tripartite tricarboxylate transporter TctB family protein [Burkholderiaceae bacterium]
MQDRGAWAQVAFWAGLGATVFVAGWRMDRLGHQGISPWSAPGLLPAVVGALMVIFALVLAAQTWREGAAPADDGADAAGTDTAQPSWRGSALAAALCLLFAGVSLGRGWPFRVEAAVFIVVFTALFRWREWRAAGRVVRGLVQTMLIAVAASVAIAWLFESVFLVRLP